MKELKIGIEGREEGSNRRNSHGRKAGRKNKRE